MTNDGARGAKQGTDPKDGHGRNPTPQHEQGAAEGTDIKDDSAEGEQLRTERAPSTDLTHTK